MKTANLIWTTVAYCLVVPAWGCAASSNEAQRDDVDGGQDTDATFATVDGSQDSAADVFRRAVVYEAYDADRPPLPDAGLMSSNDTVPPGYCGTPFPNCGMTSMWAGGPADIWAAGVPGDSPPYPDLAAHFNGTDWTTFLMDPGYLVTDLTGFADIHQLWAVGYGDLIKADYTLEDDGSSTLTSWTTLPAVVETYPGITYVQFQYALWANTPEDIWTVGLAGGIRHWDGHILSSTTRVGVYALWGVWGSAADDVWAVGDAGTMIHWDGSTWTRFGTSTWENLKAIRGNSKNDIYATSDQGRVLHFDGSSWSTLALVHPSFQDLGFGYPKFYDVWGITLNDVWTAGTYGLMHWDGQSWSRAAYPEVRPPVLFAMAHVVDHEFWTVGLPGLLHYQ